jgi:penicillin-binding protein-related factor A (putative recombinase)
MPEKSRVKEGIKMESEGPTIILRRIIRTRKYGKSRQGKMFEQMTRNALKAIEEESHGAFWFQRLWDYKTYIAVNPLLFCAKQPADFMACCAGHFYLIECKSSVMNRFTLANLKPHQEQAMKVIEGAGGNYWLLMLHRHPGSRDHELYALDPAGWTKVKQITAKQGLVSADWKTIADIAKFTLKRRGATWDLAPLFDFHYAEEALEAPVRLRKRRHLIGTKKRATSYILSKEFPGVAMFDPETEEIIILTDIWFGNCWEAWIRNFEKFMNYIIVDLSVTNVHELIHWATEPRPLVGKDVTKWEDKVELVAKRLVFGDTSECVCTIDLQGGEEDG